MRFDIASAALLLIYSEKVVLGLSFFPDQDNDPFLSEWENDDRGTKQHENLPPVLSPGELDDETRSLPRGMRRLPQFITDNCPLVHLYSEERYWPSDIQDYVSHFHLTNRDGENISTSRKLTLQDLKETYTVKLKNGTYANVHSSEIYMTADSDFDEDPPWLLGHQPEYGTGSIRDGPAVVIVVDKGNGWVDAYWFYFYPFNWGPYIMGGGPWGNHVGDWEHSLVRFYMGQPKYLWMSAHGGGSAYKFEAIEKVKKLRRVDGKVKNEIVMRPLIFSARGTHANYASVGQHSHDVPFFFMPLSDFTDRGPMWDPSLNYYGYMFDGESVSSIGDREADLGSQWLHFEGRWGDKQLPWRDPRQRWCPVQWKYIDGPKGPLFKNLQRVSLCPSFKWWNLWKGCPPRRWIKRGEGLDAEKNDTVGDNCGVLLYKIRPKWLRGLCRFLMWKGVICFIMDYFTG
ncbi:Vps62p KNAG_0B00710 [Huiozyma naganishii CBS 8797]|uniref:Vacuolar protein sorting-associated protein 62 n=1 Tax=Huiozyma naganishii (strain ATCC MYA-139 / BCRC 22969 / CBS 8797 / KCTC 17520 / NBRC 10181 / NCYC 3082 / Yp74L-3) TaxID=1071383 RepID=J7S365_HUIN7|nr:hypothetical protein KNAG_0B00710 [Kazachstania naganishii CBS 8797]CCK68519.1 hypothetical protein KNAG_0B00710 [Kazachstania naganishii CBS 8797]